MNGTRRLEPCEPGGVCNRNTIIISFLMMMMKCSASTLFFKISYFVLLMPSYQRIHKLRHWRYRGSSQAPHDLESSPTSTWPGLVYHQWWAQVCSQQAMPLRRHFRSYDGLMEGSVWSTYVRCMTHVETCVRRAELNFEMIRVPNSNGAFAQGYVMTCWQ
jgi:hypothetical protein